jgi:hypothetical protein
LSVLYHHMFTRLAFTRQWHLKLVILTIPIRKHLPSIMRVLRIDCGSTRQLVFVTEVTLRFESLATECLCCAHFLIVDVQGSSKPIGLIVQVTSLQL